MMTHPSVRDIALARTYFVDQHEQLAGVDDPEARSQADLLELAMQECDDQIRDRRCAEEVHQQGHARGMR
jgi:hypothetical protein